LAPLFPRIVKAFLIGRDGPAFAETLSAHGVANDVAGTLDSAVRLAFAHARASGTRIVLFSPAAASFDQFKSFEHRGEHFVTLVREAA
jgi:UDP-N-acetylmuramoylalanine--D-glutamate ligase